MGYRRGFYYALVVVGYLVAWRILSSTIFSDVSISGLFWWGHQSADGSEDAPPPFLAERAGVDLAPGSTRRVAIVNVAGFHHEVYPAFHYAFQRAGYAVRTYAYRNDRRITDGLKDWNFSIKGLGFFSRPRLVCGADLAVFTSFENGDDFDFAVNLIDLGCVKNFAIVIHNPEDKILPLIARVARADVNLEIYTLGPHTAEAMRALLEGRDDLRGIRVSYVIPIFPFQCSGGGGGDRDQGGLRKGTGAGAAATGHASSAKNRTNFAIQGNFSPHRRCYSELLFDLVKYREQLPDYFRLLILGAGARLAIPSAVSSIAHRVVDGPYCTYNGHIRDSVALLTSFASDVYYKTKASSSVASSLINEVPLLTSPETPRVYSYLSATSIWAKRPNQSDVEAMIEILALPDLRDRLREKKLSLAADVARGYEHNRRTVAASMSSFGKRHPGEPASRDT